MSANDPRDCPDTIVAEACGLDSAKYADYERLAATTRYGVHLQPIWFEAYINAFACEQRTCMLEARGTRTRTLYGLLPLVRKDSRESRLVTERRFVAVGHRPADFFDVLATPGLENDVTRAFALWLRRHWREWDGLTLGYVPQCSRTWPALVSHLRKEGFEPTVANDEGFLKIDTTKSYDEYLKALGAGKLKDLRYYRRRLLTQGSDVVVEHVFDGIDRYFDDFAATYADRRATKGQQNPMSAAQMPQRAFMKEIVRRYQARGWIRLSLLKVEGRIVASAYTLIHNRIVYYSMPAFDDAYRQYAPGRLLLMELIKAAFEDPGVDEFNFMRSEMSYKRWFEPTRESYVSIQLTNCFSLRIRALAALRFLKAWRRPVFAPVATGANGK